MLVASFARSVTPSTLLVAVALATLRMLVSNLPGQVRWLTGAVALGPVDPYVLIATAGPLVVMWWTRLAAWLPRVAAAQGVRLALPRAGDRVVHERRRGPSCSPSCCSARRARWCRRSR